MCVCAMGLSACSLDEVRQDIDALENRVAALEEWQASLNSDILALKQLVAGLEERNLITSVTPVLEQGVEVGYRITFQTGDPIVIYHGEDSSYIPLFGVAENDAGDYCWTLDGEFIKDKDGNLIPASSGIAPQVRINSDKIWEISTDGGQTWKSTGVPATGEKGDTGDALFADIDYTTDPESVTFTLADGTVLVIPRCMELGIGFADGNGIYAISPDNNVIELILTGITADNYNAIIAELKAEDGTSDIDIATKAGDEVVVTPPTFNEAGVYNGDAKITINKEGSAGEQALLKVTLLDNDGNEVTSSRVIEFYGNVLEAAAQTGGQLTLQEDMVISNTVVVPEGKTLELDLGGHTLSNTSDIWDEQGGQWSYLSVRGGTLIIKNGTIDAKENDCYAIDVQDGGKVIIESGTYKGNVHAVYVKNGEAEIKGGTFSIKQKYYDDPTKPYEFVINCKDDSYESGIASVTITGGSFENFNPANCMAEGLGTNFVPEGYCSKISDSQGGKTIYTVTQTTETTTAEDFSAAIEAQASEIVLGADVTIAESMNMSQVQSINLNNHTLTITGVQSVSNNSDVSIANGNIKLTDTQRGIILGGANSKMTIEGVTIDASSIVANYNALACGSVDHPEWKGNTLTVKNTEIKATTKGATGINIRGTQELIVEDSKIEHEWFGITQHGTNPGSKFTISNTIISGFATGIYLSNNANGPANTLIVEGGSIHSEAGSPIEVKKTDITVNGTTLSSDAAPSYDFNAGGAGASGHAIVLAGYQEGKAYEGNITCSNITYVIPEGAFKIAKYNGSTVEETAE